MPPSPEQAERAAETLRRELLFLLLIGHERLPPLLSNPRSLTLSTRMPRLILARIGLSDGIERFLGDAEVRDADRHDAASCSR